MYRGTDSGNSAEIDFVKNFNFNKNALEFHSYLEQLKLQSFEKKYMVRVVTKQFSKLSNQTVMTRADTYLIKSEDTKIEKILNQNNYYLDENLLKEYNINYEFIKFSGISVKLSDSSNFQILKLTPDSFYSLFGEYDLGAGASIYCLKEEELVKNDLVIKGWKTSKENIIKKYSNFIPDLLKLNYTTSLKEQLDIYKKLKDFSNKKITEIVNSNKHLQEIIFNGYHIYEEPYSASFFYKGKNIERLTYIPFNITTGSGRSKGIFTIVLKPKNETIK